MAYQASVTIRPAGELDWVIEVDETNVEGLDGTPDSVEFDLRDPAGDESAAGLPFYRFRLIQVDTIKRSGQASTVQPKLERLEADGSTYQTLFEPDSGVDQQVFTLSATVRAAVPAQPESGARILRHSPQADEGTDNSVLTRYMVRKGW